MAKNPFLLCFEASISEKDIEFLKDFSDQFFQIYPHTFLLQVDASPSTFRRSIDLHFADRNHFTCQIQKGEKFSLLPLSPDEQSSE